MLRNSAILLLLLLLSSAPGHTLSSAICDEQQRYCYAECDDLFAGYSCTQGPRCFTLLLNCKRSVCEERWLDCIFTGAV